MVGAEQILRRNLVMAARQLSRQWMMPGVTGNLSARLDGERILITPSGVTKGRLKAADLLVLNLSQGLVEPVPAAEIATARPSTEAPLHLALYRRFSGVGAVVHAHPVHATALAAAHRPIAVDTLAEALFALGDVAMVPYFSSSDPELGQRTAEALEKADAALLLNHGAITIGGSIAAAVGKMEILESLAQITACISTLGGGISLPATEINRLRMIWLERRWSIPLACTQHKV